MTVFFHIGAEKCASTSIQQTLQSNEVSLEKASFLVPRGLGRATAPLNHTKLVPIYYGDDVEDGLTEYFFRGAVRNHFRGCVLKLISELASEASHDNILFTSEHFSSRLRSVDSVRKLAAFTTPIKREDPRKIILIVRNQYDWHVSAYNTYIKCGGTSLFEDWLEVSLSAKSACWLDIVTCWGEVFGAQNIVVMPLHDVNAHSRVEHRFLRKLGLGEHAIGNMKIPSPQNSSSSFEVLERIREINTTHPWMLDGVINAERASMVNAIIKQE